MRREYLAGIGFVGVAVVLGCIMYFYNPEQQQTNLPLDNHGANGAASAGDIRQAGDAPERKLTSMNPPQRDDGAARAAVKPVEPGGIATNLPSANSPDAKTATPPGAGAAPNPSGAAANQPIGSLLTHNPDSAGPGGDGDGAVGGPLPPAPDSSARTAGSLEPARPDPAKPDPAKGNPTEREAAKPDPKPFTPEPRRGGELLKPSGGSNSYAEKPRDAHTGEIVNDRPSTPGNASPPPAGSAPLKYTIAKNDTLVSLAERYYGDKEQWRVIVKANKGLNPRKLYVGKSIVIPPREGAAAAATPHASGSTAAGTSNHSSPTPPAGRAISDPKPEGRGSYTVQSSDTLVKIARSQLGDGERWREIYELNRDKLKDPNRVVKGMVLRMPAKTAATAARTTP